jgi:sarcosine oxidase subunit gamma
MRDAPPLGRFIFRGDANAARRAAAGFGVELPAESCRSATKNGRGALWLGPDEWLLLVPYPAISEIRRDITDALRDLDHALVDVTHRQVGIILDTPHAAAMLNTGCPLDLDPRAFPVGAATRSIFGKAEIVLWRTGETTFHLEIARSFAPYLREILAAADREHRS